MGNGTHQLDMEDIETKEEQKGQDKESEKIRKGAQKRRMRSNRPGEFPKGNMPYWDFGCR